jgi:carbamoyltransferase
MRILGISPAHDSSVAIINDGEIEFFIKEERLSRVKRDKQPFLALQLAKQKVKGPVDAIVLSSPSEEVYTTLQLEMARKLFDCPTIFQMSNLHHLSHASLAFYNSGFNKSLVIVVDRNGSPIENIARESETVFLAEYPNLFTELYKNYWSYNLGQSTSPAVNKIFEEEKLKKPNCNFSYNSLFGITKVYESATTLIGQHILENGKTMGLSAYGKEIENFPSLFTEDGAVADNYFTHKTVEDDYVSVFYPYKDLETNLVSENNYELYADYAYQVQKQTQQQVVNIIKESIDRTEILNVCITGGYGLNVVANSFYIEKFPNVNFFFEPLADDSGNSLGAAMFIYRELTKDNKIIPIKDTFFSGTSHSLVNIESLGRDCFAKEIAVMLSEQKSIAIYNGLSEAGPRALGNRSILFDARNKNAKTIVNKIKNREWYRPFAASVLESDAKDYFYMGVEKSPYMTISFKVKENYINKIPGVIHVDKTCRIQTVSEDNKHLFQILQEFKKLTNEGILLNTSFNLAGKPLVETPEDALDVLYNSTLDAIWFPEINKIVERNKKSVIYKP